LIDALNKVGQQTVFLLRIVGKCLIGSNTIFGAHSFVKDLDVPDNSMVVGRYPNHRILPLSKEVRDEYFDIFNRSNVNL